jgi:hypothetical protein
MTKERHRSAGVLGVPTSCLAYQPCATAAMSMTASASVTTSTPALARSSNTPRRQCPPGLRAGRPAESVTLHIPRRPHLGLRMRSWGHRRPRPTSRSASGVSRPRCPTPVEAPKLMGKRATQGLGPLSRRAPPRQGSQRRGGRPWTRCARRKPTRPGYCNGSTITSVSTRAAVSSLVAGLGPRPSAKARSSRRCPSNQPGRA